MWTAVSDVKTICQVNPSSSEEAEAYARKQLADWGPILERRNIKLD